MRESVLKAKLLQGPRWEGRLVSESQLINGRKNSSWAVEHEYREYQINRIILECCNPMNWFRLGLKLISCFILEFSCGWIFGLQLSV